MTSQEHEPEGPEKPKKRPKRARKPKEAPPPGAEEAADGRWPMWRRILEGVIPTAEGEDPPALKSVKAQFRWILWSFVGLFCGGVAGLLVVLIGWSVPDVFGSVLGLIAGVILGAASALLATARLPWMRKGGAVAVLLLPLFILILPMLLLLAVVRGKSK